MFERARTARAFGLEPGGYVLVTLHRPALTDGPLLEVAIEELRSLASRLPVVFSVHPRTRARLEEKGLDTSSITLLEPLGYIEFMSLVADAAALLTDSGGIQEETTYLGIPCFTLRENTERPVTVTSGTNVLLGLAPDRIGSLPDLISSARAEPDAATIPGWDGAAAARVVEILAQDTLPSRAEAVASRGTTTADLAPW